MNYTLSRDSLLGEGMRRTFILMYHTRKDGAAKSTNDPAMFYML